MTVVINDIWVGIIKGDVYQLDVASNSVNITSKAVNKICIVRIRNDLAFLGFINQCLSRPRL